MERKAYTVSEVAEMFHCHPATIQRRIRDGTIKSIELLGDYRIPVSEVERLVAVRDDDNG